MEYLLFKEEFILIRFETKIPSTILQYARLYVLVVKVIHKETVKKKGKKRDKIQNGFLVYQLARRTTW